MANRELQRTIESVATSDGAGVKLRRSLGSERGWAQSTPAVGDRGT